MIFRAPPVFALKTQKIKSIGTRIALLLLTPVLLFSSAEADATSRKSKEFASEERATTNAPVATLATDILPATSSNRTRTVSVPFRRMGAVGPLGLRGVMGSASLPFSVRSDEVVIGARLKVNYNYSPSLIPEVSHIQVLVNDEVVSVIPLPKDRQLNNTRDIEIDPRLFTDYNKLMFRLIGHYTYRCEDPLHSSLWANISHLGTLDLTLAPLALTNDLKILPLPFFDRRDENTLKLPFVFADTPNLGTLKAAGVVASWFGGLASYRGAQFPSSISKLPAGNAIVFLQGDDRLSGLPGATINGPGLAIEPHPTNPDAKLLVVSGRNEGELMQAVRALVFNSAALSGQRVLITKENEPAPRKPYDAPAWVPTDRPVRFAELARPEDLQVRGYFPDVVKVNFRMSPDLFTWRSAGVPMELKYRYTKLPFNKNSSLNVSINRNFVHSLSLSDASGDKKTAFEIKEKLKLPVLEDNLAIRNDLLFVPPYQVGARNQLQMRYYFEIVKEDECRDSLPDNLEGAVDADSTLDFSGFPHYTALPNLAYFANIGFPFTRYADLAETGVVLPEKPNTDELGLYLALMGRMGEATGYPVLRHAIVSATEVDKVANRDLIVIGSGQSQSLMSRWADRLPMVDANGERRLRSPDVLRRLFYRWEEKDLQSIPTPEANLSLSGAGPLTTLMAFESPLAAKRSVVFVYADKSEDLAKITDTLNEQDKLASIQGDFVVLNNSDPQYFRVSDTYYVGSLPILTQLGWILSRHPLAAGLLAVLAALLIAAALYRGLRKLAAKRLSSSS